MERPLQITYKGLETSEFLDSLIRERAAKLERYHPNVIGCRVVVEVPHRSAESGKTPIGIAVEVEVPGRNLVVAKAGTERREAKNDHTQIVTRAFDMVQRQLEDGVEAQRDVNRQTGGSDLQTGQIVRLFKDADYGFVEVRGGPDLHFTRSDVISGNFDELEVGTMVQVTPSPALGPMGPRASEIRLFTRDRTP
ncbi:HPF/RaiA family ribosome-associated protein [Geminicoccus flavidas]|uniref:HPF/RaiA family ribosome-associated protein n=1 Tax=Geminicoccus flavidas TaxID=2506407 RepID=UPI00135C530E|nr:HPF/RaiA family ribosome-associated protein [Geminicoccus flavidas]